MKAETEAAMRRYKEKLGRMLMLAEYEAFLFGFSEGELYEKEQRKEMLFESAKSDKKVWEKK